MNSLTDCSIEDGDSLFFHTWSPCFDRRKSYTGAWGRQGEMNNSRWRYWLIKDRCNAMPGRFRGDMLRCAATRRHTFGTGVVKQTAYLEKRGLNAMHTTNKCRVFRCTVNWARARLRTAFIASGTAASSRFSTVLVHNVHGLNMNFR